MKRQVITGQDAKDQILEGAEILYQAVSSTLGPKGLNAVIEAFGEPIVTHDGVTVARSIEIESEDRPGARVGIEMIKASSSKTNDNVGDGTTSSTILAYTLIKKGMDFIRNKKNPMVLRRELEAASEEVLKNLSTLAEPITTKKKAIEVATISAEDKEVGEIVGSMYHTLTHEGMIAIEIGDKPEIEHNIVEGYTFDRGVISPLMIQDARTQSTTFEEPPVLVLNQVVGLADVLDMFEEIYKEGKDQIVIVAEDFKTDLISQVIKQRGKFDIVGIKAPGFGDNRLEALNDVAKICGTRVFGPRTDKKLSEMTIDELGTCEKIVVTNKETVITGGSDVTEHIADVQAKAKDLKSEYEREKLEKRVAQLKAKIGVIRVGGITEMAAEERKYLVDDAVGATEAALKEGIVPGGGTTYVHLSRQITSDTDGAKILKDALEAPFRVLMDNAGERPGLKLSELTEFGKGFDVMGDGELVDLKEHGIIDPVLVIKQAITNAVSVAGSALTTGVLIVNEKKKVKDEEED